jgi:glucokinase
LASGSEGQRYTVGLDLGGTKMMALVFDHKLKVVGRERKKTRAYEGADAGIDRIARTIQSAVDMASIKLSDVAAVGIGAPGQLDLEKGAIINSPNLGWKNVPLAKRLSSALSTPVIVSNDVDAGVYGEYAVGAAKGARCVVGIFPGTGIGGGCVYEGTLIRGGSRSCMEVGHLPLAADGALCGCGRRGCLETVASRLAIAGQAAAAAYRGEAPYLMKSTGCDIEKIRAGALADSVKAGDKAVELIVRHAAQWLGRGVAVMVNLLTPDVVLLGGGLVEAMADIYLKEVETAARANVMPAYEGSYRLVASSLGDDAVAAGAAAWAGREQKV